MTETIDTNADQALKAKHRAMWALGDYPTVAIDLIAELGPALVAASGVRAGQGHDGDHAVRAADRDRAADRGPRGRLAGNELLVRARDTVLGTYR
jgi:hypothetical protein